MKNLFFNKALVCLFVSCINSCSGANSAVSNNSQNGPIISGITGTLSNNPNCFKLKENQISGKEPCRADNFGRILQKDINPSPFGQKTSWDNNQNLVRTTQSLTLAVEMDMNIWDMEFSYTHRIVFLCKQISHLVKNICF